MTTGRHSFVQRWSTSKVGNRPWITLKETRFAHSLAIHFNSLKRNLLQATLIRANHAGQPLKNLLTTRLIR